MLGALTGRSLSVDEQPLADGCRAEMIHTDSAVSFPLPLKDRLRACAAARVGDDAFLQSVWQARHSKNIFMAPFTLTGARFKALLEIAWKDKQSKQCMTAANSLVAALHCVTRAHYTLLFSIRDESQKITLQVKSGPASTLLAAVMRIGVELPHQQAT